MKIASAAASERAFEASLRGAVENGGKGERERERQKKGVGGEENAADARTRAETHVGATEDVIVNRQRR